MANENKWEYDYSTLYGAPGTPAGTYPNAGSTGSNAANSGYAAPTAPNTPQPPVSPVAPGAGSVNFTGNAAGQTVQPPYAPYGYNGAVPPTGTAPQQAAPSHKAPKKPKGTSHGVGARVAAAALALAVGFGGGVAGGYLAGRQTGGTRVVTQTVQRDNTAGTVTTSTNGSNLSLSEVSSLVMPSVVVITTEEMVTTGGWYGQSQVVSGAGSGVLMSADGYIMTCAHVISGASHISVTIGEESYDATVVGSDSESDIAVIKVDASGLTPAVMGDSDSLVVGEGVVAVGNPLGVLGGTVTDGIVSALNRDVVVEDQDMNLIQTSASISPGNSGGGLFNMAGELIGIVNAKSSDTSAEGLGFAIPINTAYKVAQDLIETGYVSGRPAIGITVVTIDTESAAQQYGVSNYGVYIYAVTDGSPAATAGLKAGDRIISIDDTEVTTGSDVTGTIAEHAVGDTVALVVARDGKMLNMSVTLGEKDGSGNTTQAQQGTQNDSGNQSGQLPGVLGDFFGGNQ